MNKGFDSVADLMRSLGDSAEDIERVETMSAVVPIEPGYKGKSKILSDRLQAVLDEEFFSDMTIAEVLGTLQLVSASLIERLERL